MLQRWSKWSWITQSELFKYNIKVTQKTPINENTKDV